jgi:hypothetical protein
MASTTSSDPTMTEKSALLAKPASKLKMVECKAILGCTEAEWLEIGAIVMPWLDLLTLVIGRH